MSNKLAQAGFLTIAQNTDIDYLRLAYLQAMSIKLTMPKARYAVIVDDKTYSQVTDQHRKVFDYVIPLKFNYAENDQWKLGNEWQVFDLTPFKETIKVESDILFTRSIDHWWTAFRLRDVVLSLGCKDYRGDASSSRKYRKLFDDNDLPDIYNGLMYFRYSQTAASFFDKARQIFANWEYFRDDILVNCRDENPTTDVVYAITAKIQGTDNFTLPRCDFINFTHMKNAINGWPESTPWSEMVISEVDTPMIRINNINQYHPIHYQNKDWVTKDIVERFEHELRI
jgi:hypothetical protein